MTNTIIFDLGGVLIDWNPMYVYKDYFDTPEQEQFFFKHVATFEWNEEQDAGKSLHIATEERIMLFPEWEQPYVTFMVVGKKCLEIQFKALLISFKVLENSININSTH